MSDTKQKALDFLESNANTNEVFATADGFLFVHKNDAITHATSLNADDPQVETFSKEEKITEKLLEDSVIKKPTPAELKALKEKAIAEYKEVFEAEPDTKLSGANIQKLVDAKKEELAKAQNPE